MRAAGNAATRTAATHMHRYGGSADIWKTQGSRKTKSCFNKTCCILGLKVRDDEATERLSSLNLGMIGTF